MATRDKGKKAGRRNEAAAMPEMSAEEVAFINSIADTPDDDTPRLVYADWLDEHDRHPRAEFIRVQCELARCPAESLPQALLEREWELLGEWGYEWLLELHVPHRDYILSLPYLPEHRSSVPPARHDLAVRHHRSPRFERGFVTRFAPDRTSFYAREREWLRSPYLRLVREIDMHYAGIRDDDIERFADSPNVSGVRRLELFSNAIGDRGAKALAGSSYLTGLIDLRLFGNRIGNTGAKALAHSNSLPALDRLLLSGNHIGDRGARAFLTTRLRSLRVLALHNNPVGDSVLHALLEKATDPGGFEVQV